MKIFGQHDNATLEQLRKCADAVPDTRAVLCADGHLGYSMPIGGVVAYPKHISPSGVGYDIGCGNLAIKTDIDSSLCSFKDMLEMAKEIEKQISFGVGRKNYDEVHSVVFDKIDASPVEDQRTLLGLAKGQLGTVGGGNHYVDLLRDENKILWIAVHCGSRGFGFQTATGFLNLHAGNTFFGKRAGRGEMHSPPVLFDIDTKIGQDYIAAMKIAGEYAYENRRAIGTKVLGILGAKPVAVVHNHHNFAWNEVHGGKPYWVVRKGATPAFPGQLGFVGGSMGDMCAIVKGLDTPASADSLFSTIHGAGRLRSRNVAKHGKYAWACHVENCTTYYINEAPPNNLLCPKHQKELLREEIFAPISYNKVMDELAAKGIAVRGGGADESPDAYRRLQDVLDLHAGTIEVMHKLTPVVVVMAGAMELDPYKD